MDLIFRIFEIVRYVINLILPLTEPSLRTWIPVLIVSGYGLKKYFKLKGKLVPFAEIVLGIFVALLNCFGRSMRGVEAFGFIFGQGLLLAALSMAIYSFSRAVIEVFKKEPEEALVVNKEETK